MPAGHADGLEETALSGTRARSSSVRREYQLLTRERSYDGFFRLERYTLRHTLFRGGWSVPLVRECVHKGAAAAVLLYDPDADALVFVEQFRVGALAESTPWLVELVAGYVEPGERPDEVVRREAREEAGCELLDVVPVLRYLVSPGGSDETMHLFCARVKAPAPGSVHGLAHEGEDIRLEVVPAQEALAWLDQGLVLSAAPVIALQWFAQQRGHLRAAWLSG